MNLEKIELLGIQKNERQSKYTFPKEQKIFSIIRQVLTEIGFENEYDDFDSFARPKREEVETEWNKEDKITDKRYNQTIFDFSNDEYYIHIIFFTKKVVVIFHYDKDRQKKISKILDKFILEED